MCDWFDQPLFETELSIPNPCFAFWPTSHIAGPDITLEITWTFNMFGSTIARTSLRNAWHRVTPRGSPYSGAFCNSMRTLSRQEIKSKQAHEAGNVIRMCSAMGIRHIGKRAYGTTKQGNDSNAVLIVGLGALGLATFAIFKSDVFSLDRGTTKGEDGRLEPNVAIVQTKKEEAPEAASTEASSGEPSANELTTKEPAAPDSPKEEACEGENRDPLDLNEKNTTDSQEIKQGKENQAADEKSATGEVADVLGEAKESMGVKAKELPRVPTHATYVIIGGGTASHAACRSIRKHDPKAKILVIGEEEVLPYMRPPLSKELWFSEDDEAADTLYFKQWNGKRRSVFFEDDTYYVKPQVLPLQENGGVAVLTGHKVTHIDPITHRVYLKHGQEIQYDKLLLATGGVPKNIDLFEKSSDELKSKVTLFRTVADYRKLDRLVHTLDSVAIVGGGFLGSELACALGSRGKKNGMQVSQIYHESGNMGKVLPTYLSEWTTKKVQKEGVDVYSNAVLVSADLTEDGKVSISLSNGQNVNASHVIVCAGIDPSTELALSSGLEVDPELGGFRVNSELQARSDIWVAGDAACFFDIKLGRRRVEHHDHAVVSGRLAGENMTGGKKSYLHQSMFWSDLGPDVGYEAIGIVDNTLDTVGVWAKATTVDSPKAVVEATGENLRSQTEEDAGEIESSVPVSEEIPKQEELSEDFGKGVVFI